MEYIVIGNENCVRCGIVCDLLEENGIDFEYKYLLDFDEKYSQSILDEAIENGFTTFPLIYNKTENKFVTLEEVK